MGRDNLFSDVHDAVALYADHRQQQCCYVRSCALSDLENAKRMETQAVNTVETNLTNGNREQD